MASALHRAGEALFIRVTARIPQPVTERLRALIPAGDGEDDADREYREQTSTGRGVGVAGRAGPSLLALIKSEAGAVSPESMLTEISLGQARSRVGVCGAGCPGWCRPPRVRGRWRRAGALLRR
ncbi:hypothetical protein Ae717Ps2_6119 [Pseudonocardia sp. Ae717_Ps2]|nr:hypothetical protein Ae717Ps2_6809 [Pseudonocardia sp. Ae717_Ps2]OLM28800.1 hypothetical protein Ae717Ps2_6119 [Pseudonocardia sp. Ae717_Ps2]